MFDYKVSDFKLQKFFSYTSTIPSHKTLIDLGHYCTEERFPNIIEKFDSFFDGLAEAAAKLVEKETGKHVNYFHFRDNKTVFQIRHKITGKVYFIGRYDSRRAIGTECFLFDGRIFDFEQMKESGYESDVFGDNRGLWKKFKF